MGTTTTSWPTKSPTCPKRSGGYGYGSNNPCNGYTKECCPSYECEWRKTYEGEGCEEKKIPTADPTDMPTPLPTKGYGYGYGNQPTPKPSRPKKKKPKKPTTSSYGYINDSPDGYGNGYANGRLWVQRIQEWLFCKCS